MQVQSEVAGRTSRKADETAGLCVLVVEDDEADAYLISAALSAHARVGRIVRASNGVEALEMVERGEVAPDLALIDLRMPLLDGFHVLTSLALRDGPGFPMVVLTSSTAPNDMVRSRLRGAVRVLSKPADVEELNAEVASVVDWTCARRALPGYEAEIFRARYRGIPSTKYLIAIEEETDWRAGHPSAGRHSSA